MVSAPQKPILNISKPAPLEITWDLLPDDYVLPDDPVENILQPFIAAFLNEILGLHGFIPPNTIIATDFGICATVNGKTVIKAPDWVWVPNVIPLLQKKIRRSYTPNKEGDPVAIVMEFLSASDCGEYSMNSNHPCGKWWFYERILQVPVYVIFNPELGELEVYFLKNGRYEKQDPTFEGLYWLESINLYLGVWAGDRFGDEEFWLRWWDLDKVLLPCASELLAIERQQIELERQRTEQEFIRAEQATLLAEQLAAQLRSLGIEPNS